MANNREESWEDSDLSLSELIVRDQENAHEGYIKSGKATKAEVDRFNKLTSGKKNWKTKSGALASNTEQDRRAREKAAAQREAAKKAAKEEAEQKRKEKIRQYFGFGGPEKWDTLRKNNKETSASLLQPLQTGTSSLLGQKGTAGQPRPTVRPEQTMVGQADVALPRPQSKPEPTPTNGPFSYLQQSRQNRNWKTGDAPEAKQASNGTAGAGSQGWKTATQSGPQPTAAPKRSGDNAGSVEPQPTYHAPGGASRSGGMSAEEKAWFKYAAPYLSQGKQVPQVPIMARNQPPKKPEQPVAQWKTAVSPQAGQATTQEDLARAAFLGQRQTTGPIMARNQPPQQPVYEWKDGSNATVEPEPPQRYNPLDWLGTNVAAGFGTFNQNLASGIDTVLPDQITPKLLQDIINYYKTDQQYNIDQAAKMNKDMGPGWEIAGNTLQKAIGAIPDAAATIMSGGANKAIPAVAASFEKSAPYVKSGAALAKEKVIDPILGNLAKVIKDPAKAVSTLTDVGKATEKARENGATEEQIQANAMLTILKNLVSNTAGAAGGQTTSKIEKGMLNMAEDVAGGLIEKATTNQDKPWFGNGGVVDPLQLGKDFGTQYVPKPYRTAAGEALDVLLKQEEGQPNSGFPGDNGTSTSSEPTKLEQGLQALAKALNSGNANGYKAPQPIPGRETELPGQAGDTPVQEVASEKELLDLLRPKQSPDRQGAVNPLEAQGRAILAQRNPLLRQYEGVGGQNGSYYENQQQPPLTMQEINAVERALGNVPYTNINNRMRNKPFQAGQGTENQQQVPQLPDTFYDWMEFARDNPEGLEAYFEALNQRRTELEGKTSAGVEAAKKRFAASHPELSPEELEAQLSAFDKQLPETVNEDNMIAWQLQNLNSPLTDETERALKETLDTKNRILDDLYKQRTRSDTMVSYGIPGEKENNARIQALIASQEKERSKVKAAYEGIQNANADRRRVEAIETITKIAQADPDFQARAQAGQAKLDKELPRRMAGNTLSGTAASNMRLDHHTHLNEEQKSIYAYLEQTDGHKAAERYLDLLEPTLNKAYVERLNQATADASSAFPPYGVMANLIGQVGQGAAYLGVQGQNLKNQLGGPYDYVDPNASFMVPGHTIESSLEGLTRDMSPGEKEGTELALNVAGGFINGLNPVASALNAGGESAYRAVQSGATPQEAANVSNASAITDFVISMIPANEMSKALKAGNNKGVAALFRTAAIDGLQSGAQDVFKHYINMAVETEQLGEKSPYGRLVRQYQEEGMSEKDAQTKANVQLYGVETIKTALAGMATGSVASGISSFSQMRSKMNEPESVEAVGRTVKEQELLGAAIQKGLLYEEDTDVYQLAKELKAEQKQGKTTSDANAGLLVNSMALSDTAGNLSQMPYLKGGKPNPYFDKSIANNPYAFGAIGSRRPGKNFFLKRQGDSR